MAMQTTVKSGMGISHGVVASRIRRLEWDEEVSRVVARLDWIGAVILVVYLTAMLTRDWVLGHWVQGATLAALGLSVTADVMAGRALGTRHGVRAVLRATGLLAPVEPGGDVSTGYGDQWETDAAMGASCPYWGRVARMLVT